MMESVATQRGENGDATTEREPNAFQRCFIPDVGAGNVKPQVGHKYAAAVPRRRVGGKPRACHRRLAATRANHASAAGVTWELASAHLRLAIGGNPSAKLGAVAGHVGRSHVEVDRERVEGTAQISR